MVEVVKTSIEIPREVFSKVKSLATTEGTTQNKIINDLIVKGLKTAGENTGKIKAEAINHKMPYYDPKQKSNSNDLIGIVKLDHKTDAVELKNSIHTDKTGI